MCTKFMKIQLQSECWTCPVFKWWKQAWLPNVWYLNGYSSCGCCGFQFLEAIPKLIENLNGIRLITWHCHLNTRHRKAHCLEHNCIHSFIHSFIHSLVWHEQLIDTFKLVAGKNTLNPSWKKCCKNTFGCIQNELLILYLNFDYLMENQSWWQWQVQL